MLDFFQALIGKVAVAIAGFVLLFSGSASISSPSRAGVSQVVATTTASVITPPPSATTTGRDIVIAAPPRQQTKAGSGDQPQAKNAVIVKSEPSAASIIAQVLTATTTAHPPPLESAAVRYFNANGTCSGLAEEDFKACVLYSQTHVSLIVQERKDAEATAIAAAKTAAEKKAQDALNALNAQITASPLTCVSVTREHALYCDNRSAQTFLVERIVVRIVPSATIRYEHPEMRVVDRNGNSIYSKVLAADSASTITINTALSFAAKLEGSSNNNVLAAQLDFCGQAGCTSPREFESVFLSVLGRLADGTSYAPFVELK